MEELLLCAKVPMAARAMQPTRPKGSFMGMKPRYEYSKTLTCTIESAASQVKGFDDMDVACHWGVIGDGSMAMANPRISAFEIVIGDGRLVTSEWRCPPHSALSLHSRLSRKGGRAAQLIVVLLKWRRGQISNQLPFLLNLPSSESSERRGHRHSDVTNRPSPITISNAEIRGFAIAIEPSPMTTIPHVAVVRLTDRSYPQSR
jgi:hypothetical protein